MNRRELISSASAFLTASSLGASPPNIDVVDISKTHILVFKAEHMLSKKGMERITNMLTDWKNQNGISIPHIVLDSGMSLELVEK
jgi:hypothetical protein